MLARSTPSQAARLVAAARPVSSIRSREEVRATYRNHDVRDPGRFIVYALWFVTIFDFHWWLVAYGAPAALLKTSLLLYGALAGLVVFRAPRHGWYPAFLGFLACVVAAIPTAASRQYAIDGAKVIGLFYLMAVGTAALLRSPRELLPILWFFLLQFAWWGIFGATHGKVSWHTIYANDDGFGPLMVIGAAFCYYFAMAAQSRRIKGLALGLAGVSVLGLVASFTRGACLAFAFVAFWVWVRSPRKGRTALALVAGVIVLVIAANLLFPAGAFWDEIMSSFTEGASEGTGSDRAILWTAAVKVWMARPFFGAGLNSWGVLGSQVIGFGELGGMYVNPLTLYNRRLHNIYFQVLSELGLAGLIACAVLIVLFFRANRKLRTPRYCASWAWATGGKIQLHALALGLEAALIGYLATGLFYDQLFMPVMYMVLAINHALYVTLTRFIDRVEVRRVPTPRR